MATSTREHVETAPARKKRWNIGATLREAGLVQMAMVVADPKSSHAAVCKASAVLLRAEAQNQKDEHRRKKKVVNIKAPVIFEAWNGKKIPEAEIERQIAEFKTQLKETRRQEAEKARANGRRKRVRRWNVKPEYRDAMVARWTMILADPNASQTARFAVLSLMLRAETQNEKDEQYRKKNKHRVPRPIIVGTTKDFYGNNAHELAAARTAAEASTDSVISGAEEDRDLRPESGQDSAMANRVIARGPHATGPPLRRG